MLTATEFLMNEPVPLHRVHEVVLRFCRDRSDVWVFGAQAVNVFVAEPRMTQDVDVFADEPEAIAESLRAALHDALGIAARVRTMRAGEAFRVYQRRAGGSRHLVDVRLRVFPIEHAEVRGGVAFVPLTLLVALKALAYSRRSASPKGATDLADLRRLLLAHPELREPAGAVDEALDLIGADDDARSTWRDVAEAPVVSDEDLDEGW